MVRNVFTTLTPLPAGISRECVMETLRSHTEMIDLNPLVEERHPIKPPPNATPEEYHCIWYSMTDRVQYLPGGLMSGKVTYSGCFHDLENGLQTHCYAPMGLDIKGKWTLGGSLPGEPIAPVELGINAPLHGLWLREDVDMKCNIMMTSFVKKTLKKAHAHLVDRLLVKAQIVGATQANLALSENTSTSSFSRATTEYEPSHTSTSHDSVDEGKQNFYNGPAHRSPPLPTSAAFRDGGRNTHLSAQGLRARSSSPAASYTGSMNNSLRGRNSYQNSVADTQTPAGRALWQTLISPKRSPEVMNVDPGYHHAQNHAATEMQSQEREPPREQLPRYNPATYPREFGAVELEAPLR